MKPPKPHNENERLELLYACALLDTPAEPEFDDYTFLAAHICQTPVALISLIDEKRQWFKSKVGLAVSETPRDVAFCAFALLSPNLFIVEDTLLDERFREHPLVVGYPHIRFYGGAPLVGDNDLILGTLCVISDKPKNFSDLERRSLQALARELSAKIMARIEKQRMDQALQLIAQQQSKLVETARMSSLGEMAAGLAHEINNPLAIIYGKLRKLERLSESNPSGKEVFQNEIERLESAAQRITRIVKGFREFARDAQHDPYESLNLLQLIDQALEISSPRSRYLQQLEIIKPDPSQAFLVECRGIQIVQALVNLINNAIDAVYNQNIKRIRFTLSEDDDSVFLAISDSGPGIPHEIRNKIMQPFFTTKEVGHGTGLGLSAAKGLIEAHSGKLIFDGQQEETCFVVQLPKVQKKCKQGAA